MTTVKLSIAKTADQVLDLISTGSEYIFWKGEIVGIEATESPRVAFLRHLNADRAIEDAAYDAGKPFDADPIEVKVTLVTLDAVEIQARVWMDRKELAECSS